MTKEEKGKLLEDLLDPYPSALEIIYGSKEPDLSEPKIPEFMAAPDPFEVIEAATPETPEEQEADSEGGALMSAMNMPMGAPPMPILVSGPSGPIPMMVPRSGGPLVPYSLTGPNAPPPMPILMTDPMNPGKPKVMMQPPGGGPLVPY